MSRSSFVALLEVEVDVQCRGLNQWANAASWGGPPLVFSDRRSFSDATSVASSVSPASLFLVAAVLSLFGIVDSVSLTDPNQVALVGDARRPMRSAHVERSVGLMATGSDDAAASRFLPFDAVATLAVGPQDGDSISGADRGEEFVDGYFGLAHAVAALQTGQWNRLCGPPIFGAGKPCRPS